MPDTHPTRGWLRLGGAILVLLFVVACTAAGPNGSWSTGSAHPTSAAGATAAAQPPAAVLASALAPLRASSAFETTIVVDGSPVVTAAGRSVAGASRVSVTTAGRTVDYVEIAPKAWARSAGGTWVLVAADHAPEAPLDVLARPLTLERLSDSTFRATYPATALGLEGDPLAVRIAIAAESVVFTYETTADGHSTSSTTILSPAPADPIVAPST